MKTAVIFFTGGLLACGASGPVPEDSRSETLPVADQTDEPAWGPVFPETCTETGKQVRKQLLRAMNEAVNAALETAEAQGGVCVEFSESDAALAVPYPYPAGAVRNCAAGETPSFQIASTVGFDGSALDFTSNSFPPEIIHLGQLTAKQLTVARMPMDRYADALLQVDARLLVFSQNDAEEKRNMGALTRIQVFDGRSLSTRVLRTVALSGELVTAFRVGTVAYAVMHQSAFEPLSDPFSLVPTQINCKAASPREIRDAYETLRRRLAASIVTEPLAPVPTVRDSRLGGDEKTVEVISGCGGPTLGAFTYMVSFDAAKTAPVSTVRIETPSVLLASKENFVATVGIPTRVAANAKIPVFGLSNTLVNELGTIAEKGLVPGTFALNWQDDRLGVLSTEDVPGRGSAAMLSMYEKKGNVLTLVDRASQPADAVGASCDFGMSGQNREAPRGVHAAAFTADKAYAATCRGVAIWEIGKTGPRFLSTLDDGSVTVYLRVLDDAHLLCAAYELDESGTVHDLSLRILDVANPSRPKVTRRVTVGKGDFAPLLNPGSVHVQGDTVALPVVFGKGPTSGAVFVYRFDAKTGFKEKARIPYGASRTPAQKDAEDQVFLKGDRVFTVTDQVVQVNRTGVPDTVLFSLGR